MPVIEEQVECVHCHEEHTSYANPLRFIHKRCLIEQKQNRQTRLQILKELENIFESEINNLERKVYTLGLTSKFKDHRIFSQDIYPLIYDLKKHKEVKK